MNTIQLFQERLSYKSVKVYTKCILGNGALRLHDQLKLEVFQCKVPFHAIAKLAVVSKWPSSTKKIANASSKSVAVLETLFWKSQQVATMRWEMNWATCSRGLQPAPLKLSIRLPMLRRKFKRLPSKGTCGLTVKEIVSNLSPLLLHRFAKTKVACFVFPEKNRFWLKASWETLFCIFTSSLDVLFRGFFQLLIAPCHVVTSWFMGKLNSSPTTWKVEGFFCDE